MKRKLDEKERLNIVATSDPINKTAALVTGKGEHYEKNLNISQWQSDYKPPIRKRSKHIDDLTGIKFGRFEVIGLYFQSKKSPSGRRKKACWVVRCSCGRYEHRLAKSIKNPNNLKDCCHVCRHEIYGIRRRDHIRQHGTYPDGTPAKPNLTSFL